MAIVCLLTSPGAAQTASPAPAASSTVEAPVTISKCTITPVASGLSIGGFQTGRPSSIVTIGFVNHGAAPATAIAFALESNGAKFAITDAGSYAPNVGVTHNYRNGPKQNYFIPPFYAPKVICNVASVQFADGSSWLNPDVTLPTPPASSTAPPKS